MCELPERGYVSSPTGTMQSEFNAKARRCKAAKRARQTTIKAAEFGHNPMVKFHRRTKIF
jgi:hypothetical protein